MALVPESDGKIECLRRRQRECGSFEDLLEPEAGCLVYRLRLSRSGHSQDTGTPNTPVLQRVTTATRDVLRAGLVCSGAQEDHCTEVPARRPTQNTPANSTHYRNRQNLERTPNCSYAMLEGAVSSIWRTTLNSARVQVAILTCIDFEAVIPLTVVFMRLSCNLSVRKSIASFGCHLENPRQQAKRKPRHPGARKTICHQETVMLQILPMPSATTGSRHASLQ